MKPAYSELVKKLIPEFKGPYLITTVQINSLANIVTTITIDIGTQHQPLIKTFPGYQIKLATEENPELDWELGESMTAVISNVFYVLTDDYENSNER